jgi:hypothetical protein
MRPYKLFLLICLTSFSALATPVIPEVRDAKKIRVYHVALSSPAVACHKDEQSNPHVASCQLEVQLESSQEVILSKTLVNTKGTLNSPVVYEDGRNGNRLSLFVRAGSDLFNIGTDQEASEAFKVFVLELVTAQ